MTLVRTRGPGLAAALAALVVASAGEGAAARPPSPVLVELYTAQGCATCPRANRVVPDLAKRPGVLPVTFSVDYWDYLGWSDTFAKPAFAERQRAYVQKLRVREIYTPEMVVEGVGEAPALEAERLDALIGKAARTRAPAPRFTLVRKGAAVRIGEAALDGVADVWMIRYEPGPVAVKVTAGENKGQTVTAANLVRDLSRLGRWVGDSKTYLLPKAPAEGLRTLVVVQRPRGGRILAVAALDALRP